MLKYIPLCRKNLGQMQSKNLKALSNLMGFFFSFAIQKKYLVSSWCSTVPYVHSGKHNINPEKAPYKQNGMTLTFLLPLLSDEEEGEGGRDRHVRTSKQNIVKQHHNGFFFSHSPLHFDRTRVNPLLPETDILQQEVAKGFRLKTCSMANSTQKREYISAIFCKIVPILLFGNEKILK